MKPKTFIPFYLVIVLFASCTATHIYTPALYHTDIAYLPKPASFDTVKSQSYLSGGFGEYSNTNGYDDIETGQLNFSRGYVFKNMNLAYGAFGVVGNYTNTSINPGKPNYFINQFFGAFGGRVSANLFGAANANTDFRFIGLDAVYSHEFGPFTRYRNYLSTQPGFYVSTQSNLLSTGVTSEVVFHRNNKSTFEHGIGVFFGTTIGGNGLNPQYVASQSSGNLFTVLHYFVKYKHFFGTLEIGNATFVRFGAAF